MNRELKYLINHYYQVQKHRVEMGNQIYQLKKAKENTNPITDFHKRLLDIEKDIVKFCRGEVKKHEMASWLKNVKGIGPILSSALLTTIDISRADHVSSIWKYAGLAPGQRKKRGEKLDFNPFLKTICWKVGESFVKSKGQYREIYDSSKKFYQTKFPDKVLMVDGKGKPVLTKLGKKQYLYSKGHIHAMAKRRTVKIFLSHFWAEWRKVEGLPVSEPFSHRII